jgi:formylglycine-generating enzyme required for sulfatase activity
VAVSLEQFVQHLTQSGLMSAPEIAAFQDSLPPLKRPKDAETFAQELISAHKLTRYQAHLVQQGEVTGLVFGDYRVLDKLGQGGMGVVLKAEHRRMKRVVAVKMISGAALKSPDAVKRFYREVEAAAKLNHPNIVQAHDACEHDGVHYLVMEYVEGKDLGATVKEKGPLPVAEAVDYIIQAARGLQYAHEQGIIHRDIKPANLLVDKKGTLKILDMGLARVAGLVEEEDDKDRLTASGQVMGTLDYMAPEQAMDTHQADARADIYALGCTLYRLLTGELLFKCDSLAKTIWAHQQAPIPSISKVRADVPAQLDAACRKMVAKKPAERQQSMDEVIADLAGCAGLEGAGSDAATAGWQGHSGSRRRVFVHESNVAKPAVQPAATDPARDATLSHQSLEEPTTQFMVRLVRNVRARKALAVGVAGGLVLAVAALLAVRPRGPVPGKTPPPAVAPFDAATAKQHQEAWAKHLGVPVEEANSIGMNLVLIPPGEFEMGSTPGEIAWALEEGKKNKEPQWYFDRVPIEAPRHHVKITKPFYLAMYPVTQAEYEKVMGVNPSDFTEKQMEASAFKPPLSEKEVQCRVVDRKKVVGKDTSRHPVETVNCDEAMEFCRKLSAMPAERAARRVYRLPTEAEWEYACRAGTTTRWYSGDDEAGLADTVWFRENSRGMTRPVGTKKPNVWGLYDMSGNVEQWCADWLGADYYKQSPPSDPTGSAVSSDRMLRGGSRGDASSLCRSAHRHYAPPAYRYHGDGFRVVAEVEGAADGGIAKANKAAPIDSSPIPNPQSLIPPPAVAPFDAATAEQHQAAWAKHLGVPASAANSLGMNLVLIPPGEFEMGSTPEELQWALQYGEQIKGGDKSAYLGRVPSEAPRHHVKITRPFYLAMYHVTQGDYQRIMGSNPSAFTEKQMEAAAFKPPLPESEVKHRLGDRTKVLGKDTSRHPVETVSWDDCVEFCRRLSAMPAEQAARRVYRLPTEAEWEYACRAGTATRWYCGDDEAGVVEVAWFDRRGITTQPVGQKRPNAWGLYDMSGNVEQWCSDWLGPDYYQQSAASDPAGPAAGSHRVLRGGNWYAFGSYCRSAYRSAASPANHTHYCGFRVVADVEGKAEGECAKAEKAAPVTSSPIPNPQSPVPPPAVAPFDAAKAKQHQEAWAKHLGVPASEANSIGMNLVLVPPGEFQMGSTPEEIAAEIAAAKKNEESPAYLDQVPAEGPRRQVKISQPFYLGMNPVTQGEYQKVMGTNPSTFTEKQMAVSAFKPPLEKKAIDARGKYAAKVTGVDTSRHPVETVSWDEALEFCSKLSALPQERAAHRVYRLPTAAEWEYACRAGTTTRWYSGDDETGVADVAWYNQNADAVTHPVGQKRPNAWGLYDMHGNVNQWCSDWFRPDYYSQCPASDPVGPPAGLTRVMRGGNWNRSPSSSRSAFRWARSSIRRSFTDGFRVVVDVEGAADQRAPTEGWSVGARGGAQAEKVTAVTSFPIPNPQSLIPPAAVAPFGAATAKQHQEAWAKHLGVPASEANSIGMSLVLIPPGEFEMGSTPEEVQWALADGKQKNLTDKGYFERVPTEAPRHHVKISRPFYLGTYPVTQAEYEKVMGVNPSAFTGKQMEASAFKPPLDQRQIEEREKVVEKVMGNNTSRHPVETVDWDEATEFCRKLSEMPGERAARRVYRLPTEAEWEYACRAGTTTRWYSGDDEAGLADVAWFSTNARGMTHPVGQKRPNVWGLYDMSGNVEQWCADWFSVDYYTQSPPSDPAGPPDGSRRMVRGGNWHSLYSSYCRSAFRGNPRPAIHICNVGFRVVAEVEGKAKGESVNAEKAAPVTSSPIPHPQSLIPPPAVAPFDAAMAKQHQEAWAKHLGVPVNETSSLGMPLVLIPPGEFQMGSTPAEIAAEIAAAKKGKEKQRYVDRVPDEGPRHPVRISKPFYLATYHVTQGEYEQVMGVNPSTFTEKQMEVWRFNPPLGQKEVDARDNYVKKVRGKDTRRHPVETVSWDEAVEFCRKLSVLPAEKAAHRVYRLPTAAEWEYACRAGTTTRWYSGDDEAGLADAAWFGQNSDRMTHPVGEKKPNGWGLYDMHGNVDQWCSDWRGPEYYQQSPPSDPTGPAAGSGRVLRGGNWDTNSGSCRSAFYYDHSPANRSYTFGFRVAADVEGTAEGGSVKAEKAAPVNSSPIPNPQSLIPPPAVAPFDAATAKQHQEAWAKHLGVPASEANSIGMNLVLIPPGEFQMGSTPEEIAWALAEGPQKNSTDKLYLERVPTEAPRHHVKISKPFYLGMYPVTQAEYEKVMGLNPSGFTEKQVDVSTFNPALSGAEVRHRLDDVRKTAGKDTRRHPVETVNWDEATEFCRRLSAMPAEQAAGRVYRLPTEAEWEYACRAGTTTRWYSGDDAAGLAEVAWFNENAGGMTHLVGTKRPNAWGLYDMHGNVWQWCGDWFNADYYQQSPPSDPLGVAAGLSRVLRGGTWHFSPSCCRSAFRSRFAPAARYHDFGFRVAAGL